VTPTADGDRRSYATRARRLLLAGSLVALYLVSLTLLFERDPDTGLKPVPSDYVWVVVPAGMLIVVLVWRSLKVRVTTDPVGLDVIRVLGHEAVAWRELRGFEVHPTPGRQGHAVVARLENERLVKVWTEIVVRPLRDRPAAKAVARLRAVALADQLQSDMVERAAARPQAPASPSRG
jgi:hypothetical protein